MTHAPVPDVLRMLTLWVQDPEARLCLFRCADVVEKLREAIRNEPLGNDNFRRELLASLVQLDQFPVGRPHVQQGTEN